MRFWKALALAATLFCAVTSLSGHLWAQSAVMDPSADDTDENVPSTGLSAIRPPGMFSDMLWATQHDARFIPLAISDVGGASARQGSLLARGNTMFVRIGDSFSQIMQVYSEIQKMKEIYNQVASMADFMKNYSLTINLYKFIPHIRVDVPEDETGGSSHYIVGFLPKSSQGWEERAAVFGDNPYYRSGGMRILEVKYPQSWSDFTLDVSMWGPDDPDEVELQKRLLAGFYDGMVSGGTFLQGIGVGNNLHEKALSLSPKVMAMRKVAVVNQRIASLQARYDFLSNALSNAGSDEAQAVGSMAPAQLMQLMTAIQNEIARLHSDIQMYEPNETAKQAGWMKQLNFVNEVTAKLESNSRRLSIAKLSERYKKYERAWSNAVEKEGGASYMNPMPELTGSPAVDDCIYTLWQAATLLSLGKISPPVAVDGGPSAEGQAVITKAMYRQYLVEELAGIRRLSAFDWQNFQQQKALITVEEGDRIVRQSISDLEAGAERIKRYQAVSDAKARLASQGFSALLP